MADYVTDKINNFIESSQLALIKIECFIKNSNQFSHHLSSKEMGKSYEKLSKMREHAFELSCDLRGMGQHDGEQHTNLSNLQTKIISMEANLRYLERTLCKTKVVQTGSIKAQSGTSVEKVHREDSPKSLEDKKIDIQEGSLDSGMNYNSPVIESPPLDRFNFIRHSIPQEIQKSPTSSYIDTVVCEAET